MRTERPILDPPARQHLLRIARDELERLLGAPRTSPPPSPASSEAGEAENEPWGAFVSIHVGDELRGCVGMIVTSDPLRETVRECARAAASRDGRFSPLRPDELAQARIEISVLTPPRPLPDPASIEVGRHGLIVSKGARKGLLLPQVATGEGWDKETFLDHTCLKAGLPAGAWRQGAEIEVFEAVVFSES
jgi:AmmeMemoRadiSam system protein A